MKKIYLIYSLIAWSIILIASFGWNYYLVVSNNNELVINKSRAFFEQILVTRLWNATHGGVYVPVTDSTQPNPYLNDSLRDLVTTNGIRLTKINPAFMTRQIAEINKAKNDLQFHITSTNPIRPANRADHWEADALRMFEAGAPENIELIASKTLPRYRYMAPLITQKSCLRCHAIQGYQTGDIRGGISISFPATPYLSSVHQQLISLSFFHIIVLLLGIGGILFFYRRTNKYLQIVEHKNEELNRANAEKDKFFSIIAHDLRSPISGFLGLTRVMSQDITDMNKENILQFSTSLNESAENLYDLLENLLSWSMLERGVVDYDPENLALKEVVNSCYYTLKSPFMNKKQSVQISIPEDFAVFADRKMLETIIRNLLSNASKFTCSGGFVYISAQQKDKQTTLISIRDTGIGIPETMINKLFCPGAKTSRRGTEGEATSGLGLVLCKEFTEKNSGRIWAESKEDIGTTFYLELPTGRI